jgi:hypothetical protein
MPQELSDNRTTSSILYHPVASPGQALGHRNHTGWLMSRPKFSELTFFSRFSMFEANA